MKVLVCNVGSTSLKFRLFGMPEETLLAVGRVERVGSEDKAVFGYADPVRGTSLTQEGQCIPTYTDGIRRFLGCLLDPDTGALHSLKELDRIGFKTVLSRGYPGVHLLTEEVLQGMRDYLVVAPAHNGPYLEAIGQFRKLLPDTPLVGVFETAFHRTIPLHRRLYSVPYDWYTDHGVQKMGYHGASHGFVADRIADMYGAGQKVISCHLGGSCSLCAIDDGKSVDSSFGFSLQAGVLHSTRNGDIDPYVLPFMESRGMSMEEITRALEKNSGLLGISGVSGDLRFVQEAADAGNGRAALAVDMFVNDILKTAGAFYAELGGLDHLVFTGGIGEHRPRIRKRVCDGIAHFGIRLDDGRNEAAGDTEAVISADGSPVTVHVIPAGEEIAVARRTYALEL